MNKPRIALLCLLITVVFAFNIGIYFFNLYGTLSVKEENTETPKPQNTLEMDAKSIEITEMRCSNNQVVVSVKSNATKACETQWKVKILMDNKIETCTIADKSLMPGGAGTFTFKLNGELTAGEVYPVNIINNNFIAESQCVAA